MYPLRPQLLQQASHAGAAVGDEDLAPETRRCLDARRKVLSHAGADLGQRGGGCLHGRGRLGRGRWRETDIDVESDAQPFQVDRGGISERHRNDRGIVTVGPGDD